MVAIRSDDQSEDCTHTKLLLVPKGHGYFESHTEIGKRKDSSTHPSIF